MTSDFAALSQDTIVAFLEDIFERRGDEETMAQENQDEDVIVVAALLHDIGHFTSEFGMFTMDDEADRFHEEAGAKVLERFFPSVVTDCVRHHVAAKRYLCATNPDYFAKLSTASVHSLSLQGGPMSDEEVVRFEQNPNLKDIVRVRYLDDGGKDAGKVVASFSHFAPLVQKVVDEHMTSQSNLT